MLYTYLPFLPKLATVCLGDWLCDPLRYSVDKWRVTALSGNTQPPMELSYSQRLLQTNTLHIYNMYPTVKKRYVVVWVIAHHIVKSSHGAVAVAENSLKGYCC